MRRVLAGCCDAVVAVAAIADDICMVEIRRQPGIRCVAVFANITAGNVGWVFASRGDAVMAAAAIADDANMVEVGGYPAGRGMAIVTGIGAGHMGRVFAGSGYTIVAGPAGANNLCMVDHIDWSEGDDAMTIFANCCGLYMGRVLADRIGAVMAAHTIAGDVHVIEVCRGPGDGRMAVVAGVAARDMGWRFTRRNITVVAGLAAANNLGMINHKYRRPEIDAMAILAHSRRLNMRDILAGCIGAVVAT